MFEITPPHPPRPEARRQIFVRLSEEEYDVVEQHMRQNGWNKTEFVKNCVAEYVRNHPLTT